MRERRHGRQMMLTVDHIRCEGHLSRCFADRDTAGRDDIGQLSGGRAIDGNLAPPVLEGARDFDGEELRAAVVLQLPLRDQNAFGGLAEYY